MNLLDNSGAEAATTPPTTSGSVSRTSAIANTGTWSWILVGSNSGIGGPVPARITWSGVSVSLGQTYETWCYVNGVSADLDADVVLEVDKGDGSWVELARLDADSDAGTWEKLDGGTFAALGTTARFRVSVPAPVSLDSSTWLVDDCRLALESNVAIRLSERAVDEVVSLLQTNLGTELAAIDTERADSLTTPVPPTSAYYKRPKLEIAGGTCHVEVFEGSYEFLNPYTDQDAQRAAFVCPIVIRLTCFRRSGETADQMTLIRRRLAAGVLNTLLVNTTYSDASIHRVLVLGVEHDDDYADDGTLARVQVTLSASVQMEEVYS